MVNEVALLTAAGAGAGDEAAVAAGDTWSGLMQRAAGHLARGVVEVLGSAYGRRVVLVVGKGNNAGDGWAAAARLMSMGVHATVASVVALDTPMSDAARDFRANWLRSGGPVHVGVTDLERILRRADVVVDCVLGTGGSGAPRGAAGVACRTMNAAGRPVVACDIPSGVGADDGSAPDGSVRAVLTVTFGGPKRGLWLAPGRDHAGIIRLGDLGPRYAPERDGWRALTAAGAAPRPLGSSEDKFGRGRILVVAGSVGAGGAAVLATNGALSAGGGLVSLATPAPVQRVLVPAVPSAMTRRLAHQDGEVASRAVDQLQDAGDFDVVVAGPGLGHGTGTRAVAEHLLTFARRLVLDADAINVWREAPVGLGDHEGDLVLTPHERELARMGGGDDGPGAWQARVERVPVLAAQYNATIVAKGPGTIVAAPDGRVWVCPIGGPELGAGGTGDVLAGIIGAAVSRADDVPLAAAQAVWWHAVAGELAARRAGGRPSSTNVVDEVGWALTAVRDLARSRPTAPFDTGRTSVIGPR